MFVNFKSDLVGCYKCCNLSIDTVSINEMSDYENLKYLPYYLGNINKEEIENILMDIKQVYEFDQLIIRS